MDRDLVLKVSTQLLAGRLSRGPIEKADYEETCSRVVDLAVLLIGKVVEKVPSGGVIGDSA